MRDELAGARRVVVKVGSSSLTTTEGGIDPQRIEPAGRRAGAGQVGGPRDCPGLIRCHRSRSLTARTQDPARATLRLSKRPPRSVRVC